VLSVTDQGHGMEPEVVQRAFEPFFTTRPKGQGTGLGLATAYGAVTDAGGSIEIESAPGAGTTVRIQLPAAVPDEAEVSATVEPQAGADESVLLVEDEDAVRQIMLRQLDRSGYRVREVADPIEALRVFAADPQCFDILLTDIVMPGMSGTQLAGRLRELRPDLPVLFMSGYTSGPAPGGHELPTDGSLLHKPFDRPTLLTALRRALGPAHQARSEAR
jgi:CheY-like chemotaxis protein